MDSKMTSAYEAEEQELVEKTVEFVDFLTANGVGCGKKDEGVTEKKPRSKNRRLYQNTVMLLQNYETVVWVAENFPNEIAQELDCPLGDLDTLLEKIDLELCMENKKLEGKIRAIAKTRVLIDRVNDALNILRTKPGDGELLYQVIYQTFICRKYKDIYDVMKSLTLSRRKYYALRERALMILSIRLWSAPASEISQWIEVITMLEEFRAV